jgi:hypothetical protein
MFFWMDLAPSGVEDSAPIILTKARDQKVPHVLHSSLPL